MVSLLGRLRYSLIMKNCRSELTMIHQTSNFHTVNLKLMFVHQYGPFQTVTSKASKHGTTPFTTAATPMSPNNSLAICCVEQVGLHNACQHKCHLSMEKCSMKASIT